MSRHGDVSLIWGDGERVFRLAIGQMRELQEKTGCGPLELLNRVQTGRWRIDELRQTLRLGLIGGGTSPTEAELLLRRYFDERPIAENAQAPAIIIGAALFGTEDEELPKAEGEAETEASLSPTDASPSPDITNGEPSSASRQPKSTECPSGNLQPSEAAMNSPTPSRKSRSRRAGMNSTA